MTICIQCAMEDLLADRPMQTFDEPIEAHMARVHPDPIATQARRKELERLLMEKLAGGNDPRRI